MKCKQMKCHGKNTSPNKLISTFHFFFALKRETPRTITYIDMVMYLIWNNQLLALINR